MDTDRMERAFPCHGCGHRDYCDLEAECAKYQNGKAAYIKVLHEEGVPGY